MLILTSNGLSCDALCNELAQFLPGGRAALVVTADNEYKEQNYHVLRLTQELQRLGYQVECFDFDCQKPEELALFDVVELIGGNPYYLLDSIRRHGFAQILRTFGKNRVLIGCSAGALVLTATLALIDRYTPQMNFWNLTDLSGLGLTDVQVLPHYSKYLQKFEGFEETCSRYEAEYGCHVIRLDDGQAVVIDAGQSFLLPGNVQGSVYAQR